MSFSWGGAAGVVEEVHDPGDFVPVPVTEREREFVAGVMAGQDAQVQECEDPGRSAYWELLAEVDATLAAGTGGAGWAVGPLASRGAGGRAEAGGRWGWTGPGWGRR
ncbi:hypothetical protein, partial [Ornithinimicrobium sp. CNJ-824]|uniref:hypothetical protein n=1 Tax=Ornithinimicrobium sp. CNJ-824 TaxID=1904966 RepID=UPI00117F4CD8